MSEEQELLARIGQLAGQINQRKAQSTSTFPTRGAYGHAHAHSHPSTTSTSYAGSYPTSRGRGHGWAPYRARGSRGRYASPMLRPAAPHRNRTLVLNSAAASSAPSQSGSVAPTFNNGSPHLVTVGGENVVPAASAATVSPPSQLQQQPQQNPQQQQQQPQTSWVAKRDRHMQLINSALYEKEAEARAKAIDETRKQKARQRDEREKARVLNHARAFTRVQNTVLTPKPNSAPSAYQITLHNIPFQVANGGSKLIRLSKDAGLTPKKVIVGGVPFVRSKTGNLHRLTAVVSKKYSPNYISTPILVQRATTDQFRRAGVIKKKNELCQRFTSSGYCYKGPSCRYIHDPNRVAICKDFLLTGKCPNGASCDLSHDPTPERTPACVHFLRGRCNNDQCRYAHVRVSPGAPVCRDFAILGFCAKGSSCMERHVHECPDYANTGSCPRRETCTLPHVDRAGQIRKMASNKAENGDNDHDHHDENGGDDNGDEDDVSSDEEYDRLDSDDVSSDGDSDDEPVLILPGEDTGEIAAQKDFIGF